MKLGGYLESFLRIYIDTKKDLHPINSPALDDQERGVFVHEYTHFLQNISGSFGQSHAWHIYDRLRQYISEIQQDASEELHLPLDSPAADEQKKLLYILKKNLQGDKRVQSIMDDSTTKIIKDTIVEDDTYPILYPDRPNLKHLQLRLVDDNGIPMDYIFGENAVSETMAYLMERRHYQGAPAPEFPYCSCQKLGEYLGTALLKDDEVLFALCDVSLLSSSPGITFFKILKEAISSGFKPGSGEEMFDFGIAHMYKLGIDVWGDYENNMNGATFVIEKLLPHDDMRPTFEWFSYLLRMGFRCRFENPHFMIHLFREPKLFEGVWQNIMVQFGNPSLHNKLHKRWFREPYDLSPIEGQIDPIHLLAIQEVRDTLILGSSSCKLYDHCSQSKNGLKVDDRCLKKPWERAKDSPTCAYGALWHLYGFSDKKVIIKKDD